MTHWVMVADLERCVGCQTCTAACRHTNATSPAVQWRKVLDIESGHYPNVSRTFVPVGCQHCADPPCMHVCPTTATRQRADGIVTIDYDICIGCAYCEVACPYQARFLVDQPHFAYDQTAMQNETERLDPALRGVAQKCTFCSDRIDFGLANDLVPGLDPRATPACVNSCIADALHFGDIDDPDSNVSQLLREQRHFRMHAELETDPSFHYVYGAANALEPRADDPPPSRSEPAKLRTKGVEPAHQQHWDWKAAGNFICGGAGPGLFVFVAVGSFWHPQLLPLGWIALAIVALGLFSVLLKIGRPLRSIHVLRQPQRSWMAREAWVAPILFLLGALAIWTASPVLAVVAAIAAMLFLFCQAMILKEAKGIPAWRIPAIVPLIVATGLAEGGGLFLAATALMPTAGLSPETIGIAAIALAALREWSWRSYGTALKNHGAPVRTIAVLYAFRPWFSVLGLALPVALVVGGIVAESAAYSSAAPVLFVLAGIAIFTAGAILKFIVVTRAGYNQGFAIAHTPARGSGMAGPAVKPGWSAPMVPLPVPSMPAE